MELIVETEVIKADLLVPLMTEAGELIAIFVSTLKTAKDGK